jgi:hypothetical protein
MFRTAQKTSYTLSILIAVLAASASLGGLVLNGLYNDNAFVTITWLGNDAVTLFLAVPILIIALIFSARGSQKARLAWLGALDYMLYNYAFYLFAAAFNAFFLIYVALFGLSIFALIFGLLNLDAEGIRNRFSNRTPLKWIGGYFLFVAAGLTTVYLMQSIGYIVTDQLPAIVMMSGHPTNMVFALDLTLLVPWLALGGVWLMKRNPWGYVIAGMLSVKGPLYTLILSVNSILVMNAGIGSSSELPLWGTLTVLGLIVSGLLFGNMKDISKELKTV